MSARRAVALLVALLLAGALVPALLTGSAHADEAADSTSPKVLVVSVPRLVWQDVADQQPPAISAFLRRAAYASLSVRAIGARTDLGEAYISISAGNRARIDPRVAGQNVGATEQIGPNTGAALYSATTGRSPGTPPCCR